MVLAHWRVSAREDASARSRVAWLTSICATASATIDSIDISTSSFLSDLVSATGTVLPVYHHAEQRRYLVSLNKGCDVRFCSAPPPAPSPQRGEGNDGLLMRAPHCGARISQHNPPLPQGSGGRG